MLPFSNKNKIKFFMKLSPEHDATYNYDVMTH